MRYLAQAASLSSAEAVARLAVAWVAVSRSRVGAVHAVARARGAESLSRETVAQDAVLRVATPRAKPLAGRAVFRTGFASAAAAIDSRTQHRSRKTCQTVSEGSTTAALFLLARCADGVRHQTITSCTLRAGQISRHDVAPGASGGFIGVARSAARASTGQAPPSPEPVVFKAAPGVARVRSGNLTPDAIRRAPLAIISAQCEAEVTCLATSVG
mmetsp:Transcript_52806/g.114123  ORF Transcript_52806/g.114123 Transcript_52806/m.114123 type:complete len:214 (-) Transcript_52806:1662-2303(-)